jgi:hypothetical protein
MTVRVSHLRGGGKTQGSSHTQFEYDATPFRAVNPIYSTCSHLTAPSSKSVSQGGQMFTVGASPFTRPIHLDIPNSEEERFGPLLTHRLEFVVGEIQDRLAASCALRQLD